MTMTSTARKNRELALCAAGEMREPTCSPGPPPAGPNLQAAGPPPPAAAAAAAAAGVVHPGRRQVSALADAGAGLAQAQAIVRDEQRREAAGGRDYVAVAEPRPAVVAATDDAVEAIRNTTTTLAVTSIYNILCNLNIAFSI